ncbi:MAG TPA: hypothetical protein VMH91_01415 [Candidatus Paceibacterota bacterium]|nr:hypothetical protein [Candidatus Paceibacterota bacterium]
MSGQSHAQTFDIKRYVAYAFALAIVALLIAGASSHAAGHLSPEVKFTDASGGGLAIVPASCPSDPQYLGDCTTSCDNGLDIAQYPSCSCPAGQTQSGSTCVCPSGQVWNGTQCVSQTVGPSCTCPSGYTLNGSTCAANPGSQSFTTPTPPGGTTFSVPQNYASLTVTVLGAGGGGGGGGGPMYFNPTNGWISGQPGSSGGSGTSSSFNTSVVANGGGGGGGGGAGNVNISDAGDFGTNGSPGSDGSSGTASGGTTNTTGGGASGGSGGPGSSYTSDSGSVSDWGGTGGTGGTGGKAVKTYASGVLTGNITVTVGSGGSGGGGQPYGGSSGGNGSVSITWTTSSDISASCSCPSGYTDQGGGSCVLSQCTGGELLQGGSCVPTCGIGYTQQDSSCVFDQCPIGYVQGADSNGNTTCTFSSCPVGYTQQGQQCVFTSCPLGYTQGTDANNNAICTYTGCPRYYTLQDGQCVLSTQSSPLGEIVAVPSVLKTGGTSKISWSAGGVSSCTVTGSNGDGGSGWGCSSQIACAATTTHPTSQIQSQTIYTLNCTALDSSTFTRSATVNIVPVFQEQ